MSGLSERLRRLECRRADPTAPAQVWILGDDGYYRCGVTGETLSAAEYRRRFPDARVFTVTFNEPDDWISKDW